MPGCKVHLLRRDMLEQGFHSKDHAGRSEDHFVVCSLPGDLTKAQSLFFSLFSLSFVFILPLTLSPVTQVPALRCPHGGIATSIVTQKLYTLH